jgi:hypothetical protein
MSPNSGALMAPFHCPFGWDLLIHQERATARKGPQ